MLSQISRHIIPNIITSSKDYKNKVGIKLSANIISRGSRAICKVQSCWGSLPIIHAVVKVLHIVHWSSSCQSYKTCKIKSITETLVHEWKVSVQIHHTSELLFMCLYSKYSWQWLVIEFLISWLIHANTLQIVCK